MNSTLTRALMKYHNDFFTMTEEEQNLFKLQDHSELDEKIQAFVYKDLGITADENDSGNLLLQYNAAVLPYRGIGKNSFMLNEFDWNEKILSYKNLYEYNESYHEYQETALVDDEFFDDYKPDELYNRFNSWARAFVDEKFYYLNLFSMEMWLFWSLEEFALDWIAEKIPYDYVSGENDGKMTLGGYQWDKRLDANGLEGWYEQINEFSNDWLNKLHEEKQNEWDKVFVIDTSENENDPTLDYIFGSMDVLKKITFENFVEDCENVHGDANEIIAYKDVKLAEFKKALEDALVEIKKTAPNVVKMKKKMKVIITDEALSDLSDLEE